MRRRLRWILLAVVVLVVGAAVALVLFEKPTLDDDRDAVDARWESLRAPLVARYAQLDAALAAFAAAGGGDRTVARDLRADLASWKNAADGGAETQVELANRLEGDALRLKANVAASTRIADAADVKDKIGAFDQSAPASDLVRPYNAAVRKYEDDRDDTFRTPIARVFGFGSRPLLVIHR
jgi:hypothetical protein